MKTIITLLLIAQLAFAQKSNSCLCPTNTRAGTINGQEPEKLFRFKTGQEIILCGYKEEHNGELFFSEFILQECGKANAINFWDALFTGLVDFKEDVIYIKEIKNLPTGPNRSFVPTQWSTERVYFENKKLIRNYEVNHNISKYTNVEIAKTLQEFEGGKNKYSGDVEELMNRLFIAALSGSPKAKQYFSEFDTFTILDGAASEDYKDLTAMLKQW